MTVRSKRKPALDPEQDVGPEDSTSVSLSPPSDPGEHCSQGVPVPAMFLDAVDEPDELSPVGWVSDDMTVWRPSTRETVINAHRLYARLTLEHRTEAPVYIEDGPVCAEGSQPQWQSTHTGSWVYDIAQGIDPAPVEPVEQGQDSLGGCRVILIDSADHEDS